MQASYDSNQSCRLHKKLALLACVDIQEAHQKLIFKYQEECKMIQKEMEDRKVKERLESKINMYFSPARRGR